MCRLLINAFVVLFLVASVWADECEAIVSEFKLPVNLKTRGKPKVGRWEKVDEVMNGLGQRLETGACEFTFGEIFRNKKEDEIYFPLTNTVLRVVPEQTLSGVKVFSKDGDALGLYANRVRYERSGGLELKNSYSIYYFQYADLTNKLQSVGHRLLLDDFVVKWVDIKDKLAVSGR